MDPSKCLRSSICITLHVGGTVSIDVNGPFQVPVQLNLHDVACWGPSQWRVNAMHAQGQGEEGSWPRGVRDQLTISP